MPAKSEAQRRWAYGVKGEAWAKRHHMDNKGKLPKHTATKNRLKKALARYR